MKKLRGFLTLTRPANLVTAIADILAGIAVARLFGASALTYNNADVIYLCIATVGLYGGGVVFNDIFDVKIDSVERPERPLPSGTVNFNSAVILAISLLLTGIFFAFLCNTTSGIISLAISLCALTYDKWSKHNPVIGPLNMGMCRSLNLLLGISIIPSAINTVWYISIIPIIYIGAITLISTEEVRGGKKLKLYAAACLYGVAIMVLLFFVGKWGANLWAYLLLTAFGAIIFAPLVNAIITPEPSKIRQAVKVGILSLIALNCLWALMAGQWQLAIIIIMLLPVSLMLSKIFAVT
ncbi:UbiA-like protein EboC [Mucilaginibacter agri]|uniref:UbiA-like protein EboC n=1 Tax=Mucilaginibacter agri TaxID=2695265 RepID=A0A965ZLS3_9SPHI|nr:UbiA-like protein EboC [Mucilaginibacter agri]NCD72387.1 UbiA-like protein EboC [Mucilaginibacter agri]